MLDILGRLEEDIFDITVCSLKQYYVRSVADQFEAHGIKTKSFLARSDLSLIMDLRKFISKNGFDIVHTHHYTMNLIGRIAAILAGSQNILTYNHNWPGMEKSRHRLIFKFLNLWTKKNIVVSETVREYFTAVVGVPEDKAVTICNGIDLDVFSQPTEASRIEMKEKMDLPLNAFVVGYAGRLIDWKRPDIFIKTASLLAKADPNMRFIVAGDGEKMKELRKMAEDLGLNYKISFLGWRADMHRIYQAMDAFTVLSESGGNRFNDEGFSLVSAEAMATGLPIVAANTRVNHEVIGNDAAIFSELEPEDIACKVRLLSENEPLRKKLGLAGRKKSESDYDIRDRAKTLSKIYESMVQKKR